MLNRISNTELSDVVSYMTIDSTANKIRNNVSVLKTFFERKSGKAAKQKNSILP
jgi:hypothetical protein